MVYFYFLQSKSILNNYVLKIAFNFVAIETSISNAKATAETVIPQSHSTNTPTRSDEVSFGTFLLSGLERAAVHLLIFVILSCQYLMKPVSRMIFVLNLVNFIESNKVVIFGVSIIAIPLIQKFEIRAAFRNSKSLFRLIKLFFHQRHSAFSSLFQMILDNVENK